MIESWYKNTIESAVVVPPESAWENIQDSLDVSMVWDRIDARLSAPVPSVAPKRSWYFAAASLALLMVASVFFAGFHYSSQSNLNNSTDRSGLLPELQSPDDEKVRGGINTNVKRSDEKTAAAMNLSKEKKGLGRNLRSGSLLSTSVSSQRINLSSNTPSLSSSSFIGKTSKSGVEQSRSQVSSSGVLPDSGWSKELDLNDGKVNNANSNLSNLYELNSSEGYSEFITDEEMSKRASERLEQLEQLKSRAWKYELVGLQLIYNPKGISRGMESNQMPHGFFVGVNLSFTNVWMLNSETISGLDKSTMHTTVASYRYSSGILLGYSVSDYLGLQAECDLISKYGQAYKEYYHGKYVTKSIDLDYITYKLILKNKHPFIFRDRYAMANNLLFGMSYGQLLDAKEQISGENSQLATSYSNSNFSAILGAELELKHSSKSTSTLGFRLNMGLNDVSGSEESKTRNLSLEFNYALKFYLSK